VLYLKVVCDEIVYVVLKYLSWDTNAVRPEGGWLCSWRVPVVLLSTPPSPPASPCLAGGSAAAAASGAAAAPVVGAVAAVAAEAHLLQLHSHVEEGGRFSAGGA